MNNVFEMVRNTWKAEKANLDSKIENYQKTVESERTVATKSLRIQKRLQKLLHAFHEELNFLKLNKRTAKMVEKDFEKQFEQNQINFQALMQESA